MNEDRAGEALAQLVRRDGNDPWMRAAILSSATLHVDALLLALLARQMTAARAIRRPRRCSRRS